MSAAEIQEALDRILIRVVRIRQLMDTATTDKQKLILEATVRLDGASEIKLMATDLEKAFRESYEERVKQAE